MIDVYIQIDVNGPFERETVVTAAILLAKHNYALTIGNLSSLTCYILCLVSSVCSSYQVCFVKLI